MTTRDHDHLGSSFESLLIAEGTRDETYAEAIKRVVAWQLEDARRQADLSKSAMAETMRTSRTQLDRVLDPDNVAISLDTLARAARAVGKTLKIELIDDITPS
ncbi:MAG: Fis family transcriptional regulator [Azospirillaceae bacterium]|nr:Fis family transcriptional regulator [Azospirillaceae bacterium]